MYQALCRRALYKHTTNEHKEHPGSEQIVQESNPLHAAQYIVAITLITTPYIHSINASFIKAYLANIHLDKPY